MSETPRRRTLLGDTGRHLDIVGASRTAATGSGATSSALKEQADEEDRLTRFTNELMQATNAQKAATDRYAKAMADLNAAKRLGLTADLDLGKAEEYLASKAQLAQKGIGLTTSQMSNMSFQLNDIVSGLAMGQSPFTIMVQQGGQVYQVLQGPNGVVQGLKDTASWALKAVTPVRVLGGVLVASAVEAALAWNRFDDMQLEATRTVLGMGRSLGLTRNEFLALNAEAAKAGDISIKTAAAFSNNLARSTKIGADNIKSLSGIVKDFAATFDLSMEDAQKQLVDTFKDWSGIERLNQQFNFLMGNSAATVKSLYDTKNSAAGAKIAIDQLRGSLIDHNTVQGKAASAWEMVKKEISDADTALGSWIAKVRSMPPAHVSTASATETAGEVRRRTIASTPTGGGVAASLAAGPAIPEDLDKTIAKNRELQDTALKTSATILQLGDAHAKNANELQKAKDASELLRFASANLNNEQIQAMLTETNSRVNMERWAETADVMTQKLTSMGFEVRRNMHGHLETTGVMEKSEENLRKIIKLQDDLKYATDDATRSRLQGEIERAKQYGVAQSSTEANIKVEQQQKEVIDQSRIMRRDDVYQRERQNKQAIAFGDQAEINNQLLATELQYYQARSTLSKEEIANFRQMIAVQVQRNNILQAGQKIYSEFAQPAKDFNSTQEAANLLLKAGVINLTQYGDTMLAAGIKVEQAKMSMEGGLMAGLKTVERDFGNVSKQMEAFVSSSANSMVSAIADITDGTKTAGDGFRDLAKTVIRSLEEMVIKMMIVAPIAKALQGAISGGSGNILSFLGFGGGQTTGTVKMGQVHTGGIVGFGSEVSRYIDAAAFAGARRYHRGGLVAGEVPAILRQGEEVLTEGDPRHRMNGGTSPTININVNGARGNMEIMDMVSAGVRQGISGYDQALNRGGLARKMTNARVRGQR